MGGLPNCESSQQRRHRRLAFPVNFDADYAVRVGFKFQPGTAVRNNFGAEKFSVTPILGGKENAGRADKLAYHHSFNAVHDESSAISHQRKIAKIYFLLF